MYAGISQNEDESICWLGAGAFQTGWHGASEEDRFSRIPIMNLVLNQRQYTVLSVVRYTLTHFPFHGKMSVIFLFMVFESY